VPALAGRKGEAANAKALIGPSLVFANPRFLSSALPKASQALSRLSAPGSLFSQPNACKVILGYEVMVLAFGRADCLKTTWRNLDAETQGEVEAGKAEGKHARGRQVGSRT
jgi:hypothetical protein